MKIALHVPSWPPGFVSNGIVTYAAQLVPALRRLGHEVFVLTSHKAADGNDSYTIDLRNFAFNPTLRDRAIFKLAPAAATFKVISYSFAAAIKQLVETHGLDVFEMEETGGWSFAVSRLKLLPVVVRLHGPRFLTGKFDIQNDKDRYRGWEKHERRGIEHAQFVTAPSIATLQAVKNHYGLYLTASRVIPNPLDAASEAESWNIKTCDPNKLLFVGRFDSLKGGDLVLRVFARLVASFPQ